jgi:hypothetical protein
MRGNNGNLKILGGLVTVLVLGVLVLNVTTGFSPGPLSISGDGGLCTDSISEVQFYSNSDEIDGEHFLVSATGDCSNNALVAGNGAEIPSSELDGLKNGEKIQAENGFTVKMTDFNQKISRDILLTDTGFEDSQQLYSVEVEEINPAPYNYNGQAMREACYDRQADGVTYPYNNLQWQQFDKSGTDLYCSVASKNGKLGKFATSASVSYTATFKVCASGRCSESTTLTDDQITSGASFGSGDREVYVKSSGSLINDVVDTGIDSIDGRPVCDDNCENPKYTSTSYVMASENDLQNYRNAVRGWADDAQSQIPDLGDGTIGEADFSDLESDVNTPHRKIVNGENSIISDVESDENYELLRFDRNALYAQTSERAQVTSPKLTFRIDADWVGIKSLVAEPSVRQPPRISMNDMSTRQVDITVDNNGPKAEIYAAIDCQNNPLVGGGYKNTISKGGSATYSINLESSKLESKEGTFTCAVNAKSMNADDTQSSKTLTVDVEANFRDTDGDGVPNDIDQCPRDKGPSTNAGCPLTEAGQCNDGVDNDNDGLTDDEDPDCGPNTPEDTDNDGYYDRESPVDECPLEPAPASDNGCPEDDYPDEEVCKDTAEYPNGAEEDNDRDGYTPDADPDCKETGGLPDWLLPAGAAVAGLLVVGIAVILVVDDQYPRRRTARQAVKRKVPNRLKRGRRR